MDLLVFDVHGPLAHFKKYYATTSALSYALPPKTALYGLVGAIIGLPKAENAYLRSFQGKQCLMGMQLMRPPNSQRMGINLRINRDRYKVNPKPTMHEFISQPHYRLFFAHQDAALFTALEEHLRAHTCVFTPTLGLANLLCQVEWIGKCRAERRVTPEAIAVHSIVPRSQFTAFGPMGEVSIVEQTMFAIEMDPQRNVTERDDLLFERNGRPIHAVLTHHYHTTEHGNIALF